MTIPIRTILVPLDLGPTTATVCSYAAEVARRFGARLVALHVVEGFEGLKGLSLPHISCADLAPELEKRARARLEREAAPRLSAAGEVELAVSHGVPYVEILAAAARVSADLVVMATHGRAGLDRALFGSTAERVVRKSRVPVVVVPVTE